MRPGRVQRYLHPCAQRERARDFRETISDTVENSTASAKSQSISSAVIVGIVTCGAMRASDEVDG